MCTHERKEERETERQRDREILGSIEDASGMYLLQMNQYIVEFLSILKREHIS